MSLVDDLKAAKAVISDPKNWIKGEMAKASRKDRYGIHANNPSANCFCALGAVHLAIPSYEPIEKLRRKLVKHYLEKAVVAIAPRMKMSIWGGKIPQFNDNPRTTHAKVMGLFDKAIEMAEKDASR
jgi:hypothetical protein